MHRDQFAHDKRNEAGGGDDRAPHNHLRTEPIELLTFVQHDLQAGEPNAEQPEAEVIDVRGGRTLQIRRILEKCATYYGGEKADRQINLEGPAPGVIVG